MPIKDVTVRVDVRKAARLTGLGKPLILAKKDGESTFKNYADPVEVAADFTENSIVHKLAKTIFGQGDTSPETLAIATYDPALTNGPKTAVAALEKYFEEDFFFIVADTQVAVEVKAIADYVEGKKLKIFGTTVATKADLEQLNTGKHDYTFAVYHETVGEYPAEALIGGHGSKPAGSITYANQQLVGITPQPFNAAKVAEIEALNSFVFITKSGYNVTSEGTMLSGEFIDVIHSKSWVIVNATTAIQTQLILNDKVSYTDSGDGLPLLEAALENVLKAGVEQGMISVTDNIPDYEIRMLLRAETNAADRAARKYKGLRFSFHLSGAVHSAEVVGEMII